MQQKARFHINGMSCQACAARIEKVLRRQPAVVDAEVNFASEEAQIDYDDKQLNETDIIALIQKAGFEAVPIKDNVLPAISEAPPPSWRLWCIWLLTLPFLVGMFGMLLQKPDWMLPPVWQFILATIVQFGLAWPFYQGAYASIKGRLANMDVLVSLGTLSIWFYSSDMLWLRHQPHQLYFEASVMVIAFVSLGKYLEQRTKKQSLNSLNLLLKLTPDTVRRKSGTTWQTVPLKEIQQNDILQANSGDRIAADGIISQGEGWFDESHLTGESKPLHKQTGDKVLAGALVSDGSIAYQVQTTGSQTLLGDMMNALSEAQGTKAPIARLADKVAAVFVPTVIVLALATFILNWWLTGQLEAAVTRAVAVLVIACPCALGLATPAAVMVGMGKAARYGIWFKDAAALERSSQVDTVVLDKTGTLTQGQAQVVAQWQPENSPYTPAQCLQWAASIEQQANHPLARALVALAVKQQLELLPVSQTHAEQGQGMSASITGIGEIKIGRPEYCHFHTPPSLQQNPQWQMASIVVMAVNNQVISAWALADELKTDAIEGVQRLQQQNINVEIMSGDHAQVVHYMAQAVAVSRYFADMTPRDKAQMIRQQQQAGHVVAMVGDGVNDAPALAAADVSFAMYGGADVAAHTASATLMRHSVNQIADALILASQTMRTIKQNLFFAFFYNILGIPLAALGLLSPAIAGLAMALSSISVLINALRLKQTTLQRKTKT
ncbi:cation-translocating P-type ATPase [Neisseriaceae bacterium ESL0693]|nr:cation-translocating P-type ATPase [Neisseriaceae bacterium ESL0693]